MRRYPFPPGFQQSYPERPFKQGVVHISGATLTDHALPVQATAMRFPNLPQLLLLLTLWLAAALARAGNDYPFVLVHGFTGWGRDELLGFKYWGGFNDLQESLNQAGYRTLHRGRRPVRQQLGPGLRTICLY